MPRRFDCPTCFKSLSRSDALQRHIQTRHATSNTNRPTNLPIVEMFRKHQEILANFRRQQEIPANVNQQQVSLANDDRQQVSLSNFDRQREMPVNNGFPKISPHPLHMLPPVPIGHALPWKHPFTSLIAGPTGSGKTMFIKKFVENIREMVTPVPDRIVWCYGEYQTLYAFVNGVEFHECLPKLETLDPSLTHLIVIDDLMTEVDATVTSLFTKKSHHRNISVMYVVQNIFHQHKEQRNISLNSHYIVLMKNPRDASQIRRLNQQMFPGGSNLLTIAYEEATFKPHGYLVVDLKQDTHPDHRLRTDIFPGEYQKVFLA